MLCHKLTFYILGDGVYGFAYLGMTFGQRQPLPGGRRWNCIGITMLEQPARNKPHSAAAIPIRIQTLSFNA